MVVVRSAIWVTRYNEESGTDDPVTVSFTQKAGTQLEIKVGRERFHAPELLFQVSECKHHNGRSPAERPTSPPA